MAKCGWTPVVKDAIVTHESFRIAVHPLKVLKSVVMFGPGEIVKAPVELQPLMARLFDELPGIQDVSLSNGSIFILHAGCFDNWQIKKAAIEICQEFLGHRGAAA